MSLAHPSYDALVVGGGPAGATAATLVAQQGHRVALLERAARPRFKVGESLMPATYWTFERLGVLDKMRASAFPHKTSVQFFSADGRASAPFYFDDHDPHESSQTWQVLRSEFDQMLLDNAAEQGVEVVRGARARDPLFEEGRVAGVRAEIDGETRDVACRVLIDASGQHAFLGRRLGLLETERRLRHVSFFTHFDGARLDTGRDAGATLILHTRERHAWFWFIPLPHGHASVGVVGPVDHLVTSRGGDPQRVFDEELARCPALAARLTGARQLRPVQPIRDFSYRASRLAGDGWVMAGDAFGFIDPIYSTGVFLALKSGEMAADAVSAALAAGDLSAERLGAFEPELRRGMEALRRLVYAFYDPEFSFGEFLRRHPHTKDQLVDMLVGNVFRRPLDDVLAVLPDVEAPLETAAAN